MKALATLFSMSVFVVVTLVLVITAIANADVRVRGYYRDNGTYVQPHYRSNPDGNRYNNWSTYPNVNPHTGKIGTKRLGSIEGSNMPIYRAPIALPSYSPNFSHYRPTPLPGPTYRINADLLSN